MALQIGAPAPELTLRGIDGRTYSLHQPPFSGPTLLVFFKTTCGTCDLAFPYINRLWTSYRDGWRLWAVAQDPPPRAGDYARRHGMEYPVLPDTPDYSVSKPYDPPATPALFLIDADGRLAYTSHGFSKDDLNELSKLIAARLGLEAQVVAPPDDGQPAFRPG